MAAQRDRFLKESLAEKPVDGIVANQSQKLGSPCGIGFGCQGVVMPQPLAGIERRLLWGERYCQDRQSVIILFSAIKSELCAHAQQLQYALNRLCHGDNHRRPSLTQGGLIF